MTNLSTKVIFLFLSIATFTGCKVYHPTVTPMLQVKKKGEVQIDGGISFFTPGVSGSLAWAATEHLAFQGSFMHTFENVNHFEGSIGYYNLFDNDWSIGMLAGFRKGTSNGIIEKGLKAWGNHSTIGGFYHLPFLKVQCIKMAKSFDVGFGMKFGQSTHEFSFSKKDKFGQEEIDANIKKSTLIFEPSIMIALIQSKKFNLSTNIAYTFEDDKYLNEEFYQQLNIGAGMTFIIGR